MDRCKLFVITVVLAACGSVDEDRPGDPDAPGGGDAPLGAIDAADDQPDAMTVDGPPALGPWSAPTRIASVSLPNIVDGYPAISADGKELFFVSNRMNGYQIWMARRFRTTDEWGTPMLVAALSDPAITESGVELADDGMTIWFARSIDSTVSWELYSATRTGPDTWSAPTPVASLNTGATERSPHVTADGLTMYFARGDVSDNRDIHTASRASPTAAWEYDRLVTRLSSPADEDSATTTGDGLEVYVDSRRDGPLTIFRSTRPPGGGSWSVPQPVAELAGGYSPDVTPDGRIMVLAMDNPADGESDLYEARR